MSDLGKSALMAYWSGRATLARARSKTGAKTPPGTNKSKPSDRFSSVDLPKNCDWEAHGKQRTDIDHQFGNGRLLQAISDQTVELGYRSSDQFSTIARRISP
jgi:hypothetical protein